MMSTSKRITTAFAAGLLMVGSAMADPIVEVYGGGTAADPLGGFDMTAFAPPESTEGMVTSAASPISGDVLFMERGGVTPLPMSVEDPSWWAWDHGNIYSTPIHWVEMIMPANTRAFSFFVGASFRGTGWIEAFDSSGESTWQAFNVSPGTTPGFGVYAQNSCSAITRIVVEPQDWGMGNFAINQDPCVQVPEPAPITLLGLGLLAIAASRRFRKPVRSVG